MITLKQITYALAVEKTLHFKKAADQCAVSPSALSTALNELEKQLGLQLFERDNKKVLITPDGKTFLAKAASIKEQVEDLYQLAQTQRGVLSYPMTVGIIPTIAPYLLPKVLPVLKETYPDFELSIVEDQSKVLLEQVRSGYIDSAILALPFPTDGLLSFEFWHEDFYWVAHHDDVSMWPDDLSDITSEQLDDRRLLLLKEGHCFKDHALAVCRLPMTNPNVTVNSTSLTTLIHMVAGKMGTTLVPEMSLDQLVTHHPALKAFHLKEPGPHRTIAFVTRPNYVGTASIEQLCKLFSEQLNK